MTNEEILKLHNFYDLERDKAQRLSIRLNKLKIIGKIKELGFYRYDTQDGISQFIHIKDNRIKLINSTIIKDAFEDYVKSLPTREDKIITDDTEKQSKITADFILNKLYQNIQNYLSDEMFNRLRPDKKIEILQDTNTAKYLFFKNTAIEITADYIKPIKYSELNGYVWDTGIIDHNFVPSEKKGDFEQFFEDITAGDPQRKESLMTMMGYLMHDNYECTSKAVLLTDASNDEIGVSAGGTGKGILGKALGHVLNRTKSSNRYVAIGGKSIDLKNNTRYSLADISTQLIHIEDLNRNADFEDLFNDITDGACIRKPYQTKPIIKMLKIMISVNHTISISNESSKARRLYIFELSNYYNESYTPEIKFGHRFFESSWTEDNWLNFYNFMTRCVQLYLQKGVVCTNNTDYRIRELIENTNKDFIYWLDDFIAIDRKAEKKYAKKWMWQNFIDKYPSFISIRPATLTSWTKQYFKYKNIDFIETRSTEDFFILFPSSQTKDSNKKRIEKLRSTN